MDGVKKETPLSAGRLMSKAGPMTLAISERASCNISIVGKG